MLYKGETDTYATKATWTSQPKTNPSTIYESQVANSHCDTYYLGVWFSKISNIRTHFSEKNTNIGTLLKN